MEPSKETDAPPVRLKHDDYSIAIICPMGIEMAPLIALLDEEHESLPMDHVENTYTLGKMANHNVVLAVMPETGNNPAVGVITQLVNDFRSVRFGLLVGVGGGIPDEDYEDDDLIDIRLGDVVVSKPDRTFGGVVQFDRGKMNSNEHFDRPGSLNKPPRVLTSAVEKLRVVHKVKGNGIITCITEMFEKYPYMKEEYGYPGAVNDLLFEPGYFHSGGKTCHKCDSSKMITRIPRKTEEPRVHYGTIGSSNIVIKDSVKRDKLREELGILCIEMEAAGLVEAFPCLVIRGICDYADSHKNKIWQAYAAATAGAYTKELLGYITSFDVKTIPTIANVIEAVQNFPDKIDENREATRRTETIQLSFEEEKTLEWLSPSYLDFSSAQNAARATHTPGTGRWLLEDDKYFRWKAEIGGLFWLHGVAGCGKTILCSTIIDDLQHGHKDYHLAYWYFQFSDFGTQDLSRMIRSFIRQLSSSPLPSSVLALKERHLTNGSQPSLNELLASLEDSIKSTRDVVIVLDALDEYPLAGAQYERSKLLDILEYLARRHLKIKLFATSRPEPDIGKALQEISRFRIDIEAKVKDDITRYIEAALKQREFADLGPGLICRITEKLLSFDERRFRWAELQIMRLKQCPKTDDLENALTTIPESLEKSYYEAFQKIHPNQQQDVRIIMMWLVSALRPLTSREIAAIVDYRSYDHVLRICTSLFVTVIDDDTRQTVKLAHFSVKEYLILRQLEENQSSWFRFTSQLAHQSIANMALDYLLGLNGSAKSKTLRKYYARYWPDHAKADGNINQLELQAKIHKLFSNSDSQYFLRWLRLFDPDDSKIFHEGFNINQSSSRQPPQPLYYASLLGLKDCVVQLFEKEDQLKVQEGRYGNALNAAAITGDIKITKWLVQKCNEPTKYVDWIRITRNMKQNYAQIFTELIGSERLWITKDLVNAAVSNYAGGEAIMRVLLDPRVSDIQISNSLVITFARRFSEVVMRQLLDGWGDEVPITEDVIKAAVGNRLNGRDIMRLLLDKRGDEVRITEDVIKAAVGDWMGGEDVIQLLLDKRGDEVRITEDVIKAAVGNWMGGEDVIQLLLDKRGDEVRITEDVIKAAVGNRLNGRDIMRLLLDKRGDEVRITEDLIKAAVGDWMGGEDVIQLLMDRRADDIHKIDDELKFAIGPGKLHSKGVTGNEFGTVQPLYSGHTETMHSERTASRRSKTAISRATTGDRKGPKATSSLKPNINASGTLVQMATSQANPDSQCCAESMPFGLFDIESGTELNSEDKENNSVNDDKQTPKSLWVSERVSEMSVILISLFAKVKTMLTGKVRLPSGVVRLEWRCDCGYTSFDEIRNMELKKVIALAKDLERKGIVQHANGTEIAKGHVSTIKDFCFNLFSGQSNIAPCSQQSSLPMTELEYANSPTARHIDHSGSSWLIYSANHGGLPPLKHTSMNNVTCDKDLLSASYKTWNEIRARKSLAWRLIWDLHTVHFFEFTFHPLLWTELVTFDSLPPENHKDYDCSRTITHGSTIIAHYMKKPDHYAKGNNENLKYYLQAFPKKKKGKLQWEEGGENIGWGVYFMERPHKARLYAGVFTVGFLCPFLFSVTWAALGGDSGNAFTIGSWITSVTALAVASWSAWDA